MIEAISAGETDPNVLAALAHRRIKPTPSELEAALRRRVKWTGDELRRFYASGLPPGEVFFRRGGWIDQL
jgi:hypothetical protein